MRQTKATRSQKKARQEQWMTWFEDMHRCYAETLSPDEREELRRWEKQNLDGGIVGTSDWPGWHKHIGKSPKGLDVVATQYSM